MVDTPTERYRRARAGVLAASCPYSTSEWYERAWATLDDATLALLEQGITQGCELEPPKIYSGWIKQLARDLMPETNDD